MNENRGESGRKMWRKTSYIGNITSTVHTVDLAPAETKTLTLSITLDGLEPGTYTLRVVAKYENQVGEDKRLISVI
jgi:uncharacterized membrane protein